MSALNNKVQPSKIILINSANCQYAEFDLSDSLHLVALNNRGKTSIINTLQFLYIDNYKEINLGYSLDATWKHYFPALGSYILFELNTLTGRKVFGLSATGLGNQPEKFILSGEYDESDFIVKTDDAITPKKPDAMFLDASTKLVSRNLESKHHRALLRPFTNKQNPMGLGLIGDTQDYRLFKRLFRQLLQLKGITIKDLKMQIEQVNHSVMEKDQKINVQREFSEPYERVKKEQDSLRRLQDNQDTIESLIGNSQSLEKRQGKLVSYNLKATGLYVKEDEQQQEILDTQLSMQERDKEKLPELKLAKEDKQNQISGLDQSLGVINNNILQYETLSRECQQIVIEMEQQKLINLEEQRDEVQGQLFNVRNEELADLEKRLQFTDEKLTKTQSQLNNLSSTLFVQLKKQLSDPELALLYQLSNEEIWTLISGKQFDLTDTTALKDFLGMALKDNKASAFELPGLTLNLSSVSTAGLHQMGNPDFLEKQIIKLETEAAALRKKIDAIQEQAFLKQQLEETKHQIEVAAAAIKKYQDWHDGEATYQAWIEESELIGASVLQHRQERAELDEKAHELRQKVKSYSEKITSTKQAIEILKGQKRWIEVNPPQEDWSPVEVNYDMLTFEALYDAYREQYEAIANEQQAIAQSLARLRNRFIDLTDLNDSDAIQHLNNLLEAIPEQEKGINDEWKRIFTSFAAHCRGIIDSVDAIDSYLTDLNRLLARQTISNLKSIKIIIGRNEWYQRILKIRDWKEHDLPLFGGLDESSIDELLKSIKPLLEKVNITVADLYDLVLEVVDTHEQQKQYQSLDLESNGTSITVKTIIFISMINQAVSGKKNIGDTIRLPFYVDEIDSLDDANAQNIHDIALKLGLIPIFASPKGSGICKRLYQLDNNQQGKLEVRRKASDSSKLLLVQPTFERIS
jgi:DNA repair exonuclease SbcCD ATPase subunit